MAEWIWDEATFLACGSGMEFHGWTSGYGKDFNPSSPLKQFLISSELLIIVNLEHSQFDRNSGK